MKLKDYIVMVLADVPAKTKVSFDIAIIVKKGELFVASNTYSEVKNKVKFSIYKAE